MDSNSGLPSEILVLCTTNETKEKAVKLLDWIRHIPDLHGELAWEPAMPAICSLIASEQLGNTVVTERRALQWSRTTPEHFRTIMGKVQKLLVASRMHHQPQMEQLNLQTLVGEFCPDQSILNRVVLVEKSFEETNGSERWHIKSDLVQLSLFIWSCRQFKIRTFKSLEEIQKYHDHIPTTSIIELQKFLDGHCSSTAKTNTLDDPQKSPQSPLVLSHSVSTEMIATPIEGTSSSGCPVSLEDLGREFGVAEDLMRGMRYLDKMVCESDDFKDLVDWSSILGRCAVFYWTCSVLRIPAARHITLRKRFHLRKKDFDKIISALDLQRGDLRRKLDAFYTDNPPSQVLPQITQWATIAPKPPFVAPAPDLVERSVSPDRNLMVGKGSAKRGRPPKAKSPPPTLFLDPVSDQESELLPLCAGPALRRALLLLRSFNAKSQFASEPDHISPESLPAIVALVASRQLGDGKIGERQALQSSGLLEDAFVVAFARLRASIDVFEARSIFALQTTFDDLALEHGLGIDTVLSMLHVRHALKESRCLSIGMDWESALVKCSVFFWTCAILKVPDVKQTLLRSRSLVSKREFDSMLQLLNSHCAVVRQQLENNSADAFVFAPPPFTSQRSTSRDETSLEAVNDRPKRAKRDTMTPSEMESEAMDTQCYAYLLPRKPGRPAGYRKVKQREDDGIVPSPHPDGPIYIPTTQFPPEDWKPPETLSNKGCVSSSVCPPSETGESKRRHTRYSTTDYEDILDDRIELWKPDGEEMKEQQTQYRHWEEKMTQHYGPQWEKNISHEKPGIPFE